jgi:flagellar basal body-associated protein FliL
LPVEKRGEFLRWKDAEEYKSEQETKKTIGIIAGIVIVVLLLGSVIGFVYCGFFK